MILKRKLPACFSETVFYEIYSSFKDKNKNVDGLVKLTIIK